MGRTFCTDHRDQNNSDLVWQWVGMSLQHKTPLLHHRHAGEKRARGIIPPGLQDFVRQRIFLGDVAFSVSKGEVLFPWNSLPLLYRIMRRGKQQLEFLLSACVTKLPFIRGTFQIMHIIYKRNYVVSSITFDKTGQYSNNMVFSCAGCMKRTLPSKFLWLFFCGNLLLFLSRCPKINTGIRESPHVFYSQTCW